MAQADYQHLVLSGLIGTGAGFWRVMIQGEKSNEIMKMGIDHGALEEEERVVDYKNRITSSPDDAFRLEEIERRIAAREQRALYGFTIEDPRAALTRKSKAFDGQFDADFDYQLVETDEGISLTSPGVLTHGEAVADWLEQHREQCALIRLEDTLADPDGVREQLATFTGWAGDFPLGPALKAKIARREPAIWSPDPTMAPRLSRQLTIAPGIVPLVRRLGYASDDGWVEELLRIAPAPQMRSGTIVGFYTDDDLYRREYERLAVSLERLGLRHEFVRVPASDDWVANTRLKPTILADLRRRVDGPIFSVDVDAIFHADPWQRLTGIETDIAFATYRDGRVRSGSLFIDDTAGARAFLDDWINRLERSPDAWDQHVLDDVLAEHRMEADAGGFTISLLPTTLCHVFDRDDAATPNLPPIVEHLQASREIKEVDWKVEAGLARRRERLAMLEGSSD